MVNSHRPPPPQKKIMLDREQFIDHRYGTTMQYLDQFLIGLVSRGKTLDLAWHPVITSKPT